MAASHGILPQQTSSTTEIVNAPSALRRDEKYERLQQMQDELLERSTTVLEGSMRFAEIESTAATVPQAWIDELGPEAAKVRFRLAKAGWLGAKEAPIGIRVAGQVAVGILRAKAAADQAPRILNVKLMQWTAPLPQFPEQDIEPGR
jgi:hypothetical protein